MSSTVYEVMVTISIGDVEQDVTVRAHVAYEHGSHGWTGSVQGEIKALVGGEWVALEDLALDEGDIGRATTALEEACEQDDGMVDADDYDDRCCA